MHFNGVLGQDDGGASKARRGGHVQRLLAPIQRARASLSPRGRTLFTVALVALSCVIFFASASILLPVVLGGGAFDGRDPSTRALATDTLSGGHSLVKGEEEEEHDLWRKHFKSNDAVSWEHFALVLSLEFGQDLKQLPKAILPKFGKKFVDKDGLVSRARYGRYVTQYGGVSSPPHLTIPLIISHPLVRVFASRELKAAISAERRALRYSHTYAWFFFWFSFFGFFFFLNSSDVAVQGGGQQSSPRDARNKQR